MNTNRQGKMLSGEEIAATLCVLGTDPSADRITALQARIDASSLAAGDFEKEVIHAVSAANAALDTELTLVLSGREWLRLLADEWFFGRGAETGVTLGIGAVYSDLPDGPRTVVATVDAARLAPSGLLVKAGDGWQAASPATLAGWAPAELFTTAPVPLAAFTSVAARTESEAKQLMAMARGFSNLRAFSLPLTVATHSIQSRSDARPALHPSSGVPDHWDALRGAAAMSIWSHPDAVPFDVREVGQWRELASRAGLRVSEHDARLWQAVVGVLIGHNLRDGWRNEELMNAIAHAADGAGIELSRMTGLMQETADLLGDRLTLDERRTLHDPVGLALQLALLRPEVGAFASWRKDRPALPEAVLWTGATLAGLLTGYRDLDGQYKPTEPGRVRTWDAWQAASLFTVADSRPTLPVLRTDDCAVEPGI